jgi:sulfite oxidase
MSQSHPPSKDPRRLIRDAEGWNTGPIPRLLGEQPVTPASLFFTRSHAPIPAVDPLRWRLWVTGLVRRPLQLSLAELQGGFGHHEVTATVACAGLRRAELESVRPVTGELPWGTEAISTGRWTGVPLAEVLSRAGVEHGAAHVEFTGLDEVERSDRSFGFGGSIPLAKAMAREVLLAFELNGAPLPSEHGFPLRALVPGYFGARSVKWLGKISVRPDPSTNYFQTQAYRVQRIPTADDPRDVSGGTELGELTLNAAILSPDGGTVLPTGETIVTGWALSHAGAPPVRVEVSPDAGLHWVSAELSEGDGPWAWRWWRAVVRLGPGRHTLVARAFDAEGRGQPGELAEVWNVKGYANNAWHRVAVTVAG